MAAALWQAWVRGAIDTLAIWALPKKPEDSPRLYDLYPFLAGQAGRQNQIAPDCSSKAGASYWLIPALDAAFSVPPATRPSP
ncbi:MAG: hypothetical protein KIG95_11435, partial [Comamonas sp.]|nr:hypothetical protein [Comamonas sp.]